MTYPNPSAAATGSDPPNSAAPAELRLVRLPEVLYLVGLKRSAWLDLVRAKRAPQPLKIGRATCWASDEIQCWIAERIRAHREGGAR